MKPYRSIEHEFWEQVRRKRNLFFLWWVGWLPFGTVGVLVLTKLLGEDLHWSPFILFLLWFIAWQMVLARLRALECPRCKKPAIAHPVFFMRDAHCQKCGFRFSERS